MTKRVRTNMLQRAGGWCESVADGSKDLSLPSWSVEIRLERKVEPPVKPR